MRAKEEDILIRKKMESLDTLSGGIVFGREEAWEKLDARMGRKKRQRLFYNVLKIAAALVPEVILMIYLNQEQHTGRTQIPQRAQFTMSPEYLDHYNQLMNNPPEKKVIVHTTVKHKNKVTKEVIAPIISNTESQIEQKQPEKPIVNNKKDSIINVASNSSENDISKNMKVVHINEINKDENHQERQNAMAKTDFSRLPVIHILDLEKPMSARIDDANHRHKEWNLLAHLPFIKPDRAAGSGGIQTTDYETNYPAFNFLRFRNYNDDILNNQN